MIAQKKPSFDSKSSIFFTDIINMIKFFRILCIIILFSSCISLAEGQTLNSNVQGLIMSIELFNPKIYKQNDEIILEVKLLNKSDKNISCFITDDKKL